MSRGRPRRAKATRQAGRATKKPKCPTPSKLSFRSQDHAEETLKYWNYEHAPYRPQRAYLCACGSYHLTSKGQP